MRDIMEREVDRFDAVGDGYQTTIVAYQEFYEFRTFDGLSPFTSRKRYETTDGYDCNEILGADDEYQIVTDPFHPKMIVRRV